MDNEEHIKSMLWNFKKHELEEVSKLVSETISKKYHRTKRLKYLNPGYKAMPFADVEQFFNAFLPEETRYKMLFLTQAWLGLRIGEAVELREIDVDFNSHQIRIFTEKQGIGVKSAHFLRMHPKIEEALVNYIGIYKELIEKHEGYLFFPDWGAHTKSLHLSTHSARKKFRVICNRVGLNEVYSEREKRGEVVFPATQKGKLYRFSPHSLRHSFCRYLLKRGNDIFVTQHLMRHADIGSTQIYAGLDKSDEDKAMLNSFA